MPSTTTARTATADGCTVVIKMNDFTAANGGSFMTATLTDPEGKAVVLNGDGSVSASCRRDTVDHDAGSSGLALPNENNVAVVSRGSVVKHYPDGRASIAYFTGDTSEYMPEDASWYSQVAAAQSLGRLKANTVEVLSALIGIGFDRTGLPALVKEAA